VSGLAAETWVFAAFYGHLKQDTLILAAVIFLALAYSVSMLNKLFMIFSMLKRLKAGFRPADAGIVRPAVFTAFIASVIAAWLK
jgi:hypothetical protein